MIAVNKIHLGNTRLCLPPQIDVFPTKHRQGDVTGHTAFWSGMCRVDQRESRRRGYPVSFTCVQLVKKEDLPILGMCLISKTIFYVRGS